MRIMHPVYFSSFWLDQPITNFLMSLYLGNYLSFFLNEKCRSSCSGLLPFKIVFAILSKNKSTFYGYNSDFCFFGEAINLFLSSCKFNQGWDFSFFKGPGTGSVKFKVA